MTTDITMKNTISACMVMICFFSVMFFITLSFRRSSVRVELDVSTSDDSVDMDAEEDKYDHDPDQDVRQG